LADRYSIERKLGEGGMATVYLATDLAHARKVAIKVLKPELAAALGDERFLREITVTAGLDHPHIVPLFDSGEADGLLFYAMPFVEGESLAAVLDRQHHYPVAEAVRIIREVADALQYAHERGVIHRDIKPQNILISAGHARVADFGIARAVTLAGGENLTGTGFAVGTPHYMSPEQAAGDTVDARSDVYSLASVLYEMLAGEPPYTGPSNQAVMAKRWKGPIPDVSTVRDSVSPALVDVITKGLAKIPADRFASAREFSQALEHAMQFPAASGAGGARKRRLALLGAAGVVGIAVVAALLVSRPPKVAPERRIAVLPFKNTLGDSTQEYLVSGMHEALISELATLGSVAVIARSSVMRYLGYPPPTPQVIGRELKVDALVEGTVARLGDSLRVTFDIVNPADETQTWTRVDTTSAGGAIALLNGVAHGISARLSPAATSVPIEPVGRRMPTDSISQSAYLKARFHLWRGAPQDMDLALGYLNEVIKADSTFAPAYAQLALYYINSMFRGAVPPHVAFDKAKVAARRAIELDEKLEEAHVQLGYALALYDWDWAAAEHEFKRALELNPSSVSAEAFYGFYLSWMGRPDSALAHAKRAALLDPVSLSAVTNVATVLMLGRRYDEAIAKAKEAISLDPNFMLAYERLGYLYDATGRYPEAIAAYRKTLELFPGDPSHLGGLAAVYAKSGRADTARIILKDLLERARTGYVTPFALSSIYVALKEPDHALDWLEKAYDSRSAEMVALQVAPAWDPLRNQPRFKNLLARMKFP
jgi:eukaryotic-like serine/threonine-protein kinase